MQRFLPEKIEASYRKIQSIDHLQDKEVKAVMVSVLYTDNWIHNHFEANMAEALILMSRVKDEFERNKADGFLNMNRKPQTTELKRKIIRKIVLDK